MQNKIEDINKVFVDGSANPQAKVGIGAYVLCKDLKQFNQTSIKTKRFENTSSTKLELQTLIWAVKDINTEEKLFIYTDCQNIFSLLNREEKIKEHKNRLLYEEFFALIKTYDLEFIKIKGHKKKSLKDDIDVVFSKVDKKARKILREEFR